MNDPAVLRKRIAELEAENKKLREIEAQPSSTVAKGFSTMGKTDRVPIVGGDKDWLNFGSGPIERPTTASAQNNQRVREL
jgi:hypothetical protein